MTDKTNLTPDPQPEKDAETLSSNPFYKQPGMIAAGVLILLALVILIIWMAGNKPPTQVETTSTIAAPMVALETEDPPTIIEVPTQIQAPIPTVAQPTPGAHGCPPD